MTNQYRQFPEATKSSWSFDKVGLDNRDVLSRNPLALRNNLILDDIDCAEREVLEFKRAGGGTIVDVSSRGLGRDPVALRGVALSVGTNLVAGSAYYYRDTHPEDMSEKTAEEIGDEIVQEVTVGIDETGVRAGVIGEIGISERMHPDEEKVLVGAAQAQAQTGLGMHIHIFPWDPQGFPLGLDALKVNVLISSDICHKSLWHRYGGWGYDHVITNVIPMLREYGLSSEQIRMIVLDNPQRFLDTDRIM